MNRDERERNLLHAYHDGELSWLARRRVEHRLARHPAARRELEALGALRSVLREADADAPSADLWEPLRRRLQAVDAERREAGRTHSGAWAPRTRRLIAAGALGLAIALLVLASPLLRDAAEPGAVRWLDSRGVPVLVLQEDDEATIIWLLEGDADLSRRSDRGMG